MRAAAPARRCATLIGKRVLAGPVDDILGLGMF
jgi:hypothetical protein